MPTFENSDISTEPLTETIYLGDKNRQVGYVQALIAIANTGQGIIINHKGNRVFGIDNDYGRGTAVGLEVVAETLGTKAGLIFKDGFAIGYNQEFVEKLEAHIAQMSPEKIRFNAAMYLRTVSDDQPDREVSLREQQKGQLEKAIGRFTALSRNVLPLTTDLSKLEYPSRAKEAAATLDNSEPYQRVTPDKPFSPRTEDVNKTAALSDKIKLEAEKLGKKIFNLSPPLVLLSEGESTLSTTPIAPRPLEALPPPLKPMRPIRDRVGDVFNAIQTERESTYYGATGKLRDGDYVEDVELFDFAKKYSGKDNKDIGPHFKAFLEVLPKRIDQDRKGRITESYPIDYTRQQVQETVLELLRAEQNPSNKAQNFARQLLEAQTNYSEKTAARLPVVTEGNDTKTPLVTKPFSGAGMTPALPPR